MVKSTPSDIELQEQIRRKVYEFNDSRKKRGTVGIISNGNYTVPNRYSLTNKLPVTMDQGGVYDCIVLDGQTVPAGKRVLVNDYKGKYYIEFLPPDNSTSNQKNTLRNLVGNIGFENGYLTDLATINQGTVTPILSTITARVHWTPYVDNAGQWANYDQLEVLDFTSSISSLTTGEERWCIVYIDRSDGSANIYDATAITGVAKLSDVTTAVNECLTDTPNAFPIHAVKVSANQTQFGAYRPMDIRFSGDNLFSYRQKSFVRIPTEMIFSSRRLTTSTKTADYTMTAIDDLILVDCSSNNVTITLPDATTVTGIEFNIKLLDASGGFLTISPVASQTIDGETNETSTLQYENYTLVSDGSNWFIL